MKNILVIDDAATMRFFYRDVLTKIGFWVDEAENGIEALEKAMKQRYELFLVDINMPKMDGISFLRELRTRPEIYQAPAVIATTENRQNNMATAYAAGANFYLDKPPDPETLHKITTLLTGGPQ